MQCCAVGKGSVNHNTRAFTAKNVNKERIRDNVEFSHSDIKEVYRTLFDEALERYNAKQKRSDRKIDDYYEKIRRGKQGKLKEVVKNLTAKVDGQQKQISRLDRYGKESYGAAVRENRGRYRPL